MRSLMSAGKLKAPKYRRSRVMLSASVPRVLSVPRVARREDPVVDPVAVRDSSLAKRKSSVSSPSVCSSCSPGSKDHHPPCYNVK